MDRLGSLSRILGQHLGGPAGGSEKHADLLVLPGLFSTLPHWRSQVVQRLDHGGYRCRFSSTGISIDNKNIMVVPGKKIRHESKQPVLVRSKLVREMLLEPVVEKALPSHHLEFLLKIIMMTAKIG